MSNPDNIPEFSVSDISQAVKRTIEGAFSRVRVRGELGRVTIAQSGHMYATLKDQSNVLDAVCWRGSLNRLSIRPEEGLEVICTGRLSTYSAGKSSYQLIIDHMEPAGEGALLKLLEERKKKLAADGLFDASNKQSLPFLPRSIGVITSPSGAVIRDILHRIEDRFPMPVLLWGVPVQGDKAAEAIIRAVQGMNALPDHDRPDILILARGGGSLEDLMPFNDEGVIRAIAASTIPTISAIGHETDTTLVDYAADLRAPTPTGAAEMAVPVRAQLNAQVMEDAARLVRALTRRLDEQGRHITQLSRLLGQPEHLLEQKYQRLDMLDARLTPAFTQSVFARQNRLSGLSARIKTPADRLALATQTLSHLGERMARTANQIPQEPEQRLNRLNALMESLSFKNVLKRGYAVLRDDQGRLLTHGAALKDGDRIAITMQDIDQKQAVITDEG